MKRKKTASDFFFEEHNETAIKKYTFTCTHFSFTFTHPKYIKKKKTYPHARAMWVDNVSMNYLILMK